jgi:6-pyruvoyltetrahydropterin/6-carboxytetrahydropterin synthase
MDPSRPRRISPDSGCKSRWHKFSYTLGMFQLTRETRFAINIGPRSPQMPDNSYAGYPSLLDFGRYFAMRITLAGDLDPQTGYLRNIRDIDEVVRERGIYIVAESIAQNIAPAGVPPILFRSLQDAWPGASLRRLSLFLSPFLSFSCTAKEHPMVQLSQKFEFAAAHRLHNPALSDAQNRQAFGKCNNTHGHGHNYELQVTLAGNPDRNGLLIDIPEFERIVADTVIERFDHKFLNIETAEFVELIPSVENIAKVIFTLLKPRFTGPATLAAVTVWETPKTWCEYAE